MIANANCNAAKELCSLFANGERVTALRLELLPGNVVRPRSRSWSRSRN